jgi:AMP-activated protein kinase-like protein
MKQEHEDLSRYLNGEIDRTDLPASLRRDAVAFERIIAALGRERVTLPPNVRGMVMARVRAAAESPWRRAWGWVTTPRVSPLAGALVAAALVAAIWLKPTGGPRSTTTDGPQATVASAPMRFVFLAPSARQVAITGDWVHWDPAGIPLSSRGDGVWMVEIAVPVGLHHYVFVIDGTEWRPDPNAASQVDDGFGQRNSVLLVPTQQGS